MTTPLNPEHVAEFRSWMRIPFARALVECVLGGVWATHVDHNWVGTLRRDYPHVNRPGFAECLRACYFRRNNRPGSVAMNSAYGRIGIALADGRLALDPVPDDNEVDE